MPNKDSLQRFIFDECDIRGELITLNDTYQEVLKHNPHVPAVSRLLGEFLAAAGLLSSTLKFDGRIVLQARGNGAVTTIMAECNHQGHLRAIVRLNAEIALSESLAQTASMQELLGEGVLVITVEPQRHENVSSSSDENYRGTERYQGIVPMDAPDLAGCLEHYFYQSEQLPTRFWFAVDATCVAGLLIQSLPQQLNTTPEDNQDQWETIITLADTITADELLQLEHATILHRLFNEYSVRIFSPRKVKFSCSCSRKRSADALLTIGADEVEALLIERGHIDVDCQFCNQHYHFSAEEIRTLLGGTTLH